MKIRRLIITIGIIVNIHNNTFSQCFSPAVNYAVGADPQTVTSADFNGDGKIDLVTANKILIGNGAGAFTMSTISNLINNSVEAIVAADFNNDNKKDLAMTYGFSIVLLIGNGVGGFAPPATISLGAFYPKNIVSADFNNDGKKDLAAMGDTEIKILLGNGLGGFSISTAFTLTGNPVFTSIIANDFNGDGKVDLATSKCVGFSTCSGFLTIFNGNGIGGFSPSTDISIGSYPQNITYGDFNNDGKKDFAISNYNAVTIALGNGSGGFTVNINGPVNCSLISSGDFNNDGALDLVLTSHVAVIEVQLGNGSGTYTFNSSFPYQAFPESTSLATLVADFNADGKMDLATANTSAGSVSVILGRISVNYTKSDVSTCFGGNNGTATATGGCGTNFSYSWNTSPIQTNATATGLSAGTYTVTVTQGNASNYAIVNISQPQEISISTTSTEENCIGGGNNGTATGSVLGGTPPYNYAWNTTPVQTTQTASNLSVGNYNVIVTDASGCTKNSNVQVNYTPNPSSFTYTTNGMVASFSKNGVGCNSFVWDFGNGNTSTINPNPTVTFASAGTYGVCIQCNGQPSSCVQCINVTVPTNGVGGVGIKEIQSMDGAAIYPNPTTGILNIELTSLQDTEVILYNTNGQIVYDNKINKTSALDLSSFANGVYSLHIKNENGILTKKIILNK
jgi:hypothetical protein